ncbi:MAG: non-ribosomal peptide synthetase [Limisphaerales bacterium]
MSKPLSSSQRSLYFLNELTQGRPVYNMPLAFRLRGPLNRDALSTALRHIVQVHEGLRAEITDGMQTVRGPSEFEPIWHDLSTEVVPEKLLAEKAAASIRRFKLNGELPFRANIFRLRNDEHVVLLDLHHIFGDMTSMQILFQELGKAYSGIIQGNPAPELKRAALVETQTSGRRADSPIDAAFWRDYLRDVPHDFELPIDKARLLLPSFSGEALYDSISPKDSNSIKAAARKAKCSAFAFLFAAFQVLLHRYSGQPAFVVGVPFSLRTEEGLEREVDYLVNLLPFRCELTSSEKFIHVVERVRANSMALFEHLNSPLPEILKTLNIPVENPKPPLTRIVFQYFPAMPSFEMAGLETEPYRIHSQTSKFDLCVTVWEEEHKFQMEFEYDTDLFEHETVQRYSSAYKCLLASILKDPELEIGELEIIPTKDLQLLQEWSGQEVPYPKAKSVSEIFDEVAEARPTDTAILSEDRTLTYGELRALADRYAKNLINHGVRQGDLVGVCMRRSPELIAVLLAILKVGAAFVPFDEKYPKPRLEYLFKDSSVCVLVADQPGMGIAPEGVKTLSVVDLERDGDSGALPSIRTTPEDLAYLMYTSGSTGTPKGVMVPHRAIVRLVKNNNFMEIAREDVFLAFAPVSFDASTLEIWAPLLNGARLAIYPPEFESLEQFESVLKKHQVTCLWLTAGLFNAVIDKNVNSLRGIRQLLAGGDVLSVPHVKKALSSLPNTNIINGYGPTENTTFTCCYSIPREFNRAQVPIGKPIHNTTVHILDSAQRQVPIGAEGELYTGGDGLSLGYWHRPELTRASFIENPFSNDSSSKLYRTGDRVRFGADGNIEFLGRTDLQVKIRGFRIELGEIETSLRSLSTIQDGVVTVYSDENGNKSLIGYVVNKPPWEPRAERIIKELAKMLPAHAVPSNIVFLDELPIGPTGKVDRRSLPKPNIATAVCDFAAPINSTEARLLRIWESILDVDALGVDANFFHSGGESLKATRTVTQINRTFGINLTLPQLFMAPTVREMARLIGEAKPIQRIPRIVRRNQMWDQETFQLQNLSDEQVDALLKQFLDDHVSV